VQFLGVTRGVAKYLRDRIITGELSSGQRLNETQLTEQLGISRPPLREAFRLLESMCLVENKPNKGTFVSSISEENLREIYDARRMIECFAIDLIKEKGIHTLSELELSLKASVEAPVPSPDDIPRMLEYWKIMSDFHVKLVESSGAFFLTHFYAIISENLARYQFMYLRIPGTAKDSVEEHRHILSLIEAGRYSQARMALGKHLEYTYTILRNELIKDTQAMTP
jgi:DNA-binding GntR family transcriptional regulator